MGRLPLQPHHGVKYKGAVLADSALYFIGLFIRTGRGGDFAVASTSMFTGGGLFGRPGMVAMLPQMTTTKPAPVAPDALAHLHAKPGAPGRGLALSLGCTGLAMATRADVVAHLGQPGQRPTWRRCNYAVGAVDLVAMALGSCPSGASPAVGVLMGRSSRISSTFQPVPCRPRRPWRTPRSARRARPVARRRPAPYRPRSAVSVGKALMAATTTGRPKPFFQVVDVTDQASTGLDSFEVGLVQIGLATPPWPEGTHGSHQHTGRGEQ